MALDPGPNVATERFCQLHPERCDTRSKIAGGRGDDPDLLEIISGAAIGAAVGGALGGATGGAGEGVVGAAAGGFLGDTLGQLTAAFGAGPAGAILNLFANVGQPSALGGGPSLIPGVNISSLVSSQLGQPFDPGGIGGGALTVGPYLGEAGRVAGDLLRSKKINLGSLLTGGSGGSPLARLFDTGRLFGLVG
jgi:hypothetical protein